MYSLLLNIIRKMYNYGFKSKEEDKFYFYY